MKKNLFFMLFISTVFLHANTFQDYLNQQNNAFDSYKSSFEKEFEAYKEAYESSLESYKKEIATLWPHTEISTQHKFVQYDEDYQTKKAVDFEKENIHIEVIAHSEKEARNKIQMALNDLVNEDVKSAYEKDQLEHKINESLKQTPVVESKEKIIGDVLSQQQKDEFIEVAKKEPLEKMQHDNNTIYKLNVKLPSLALIKKAQQFKQSVDVYASKNEINKELVYAVIHSESSFNPMARSHIPAFGLMQIVPQSAGVDTYHFLYGEKKLLSSTYLYNPTNNIKIGATYLHIVYFKYLRHIKDPLSRLYCAIAAYNTGAGNVARSFIGSNNIKKASEKINTLTPDEVYKHLMRNLPYNETKHYLQKVNDRRFVYLKLINDNTL
jgi:membrane-bound lytic murein transglycosylase C